MHQDGQDGVPTGVILAPCSGPSRRGLATLERPPSSARRPALTGPRAARFHTRRPGRRNGRQARTKEQREAKGSYR